MGSLINGGVNYYRKQIQKFILNGSIPGILSRVKNNLLSGICLRDGLVFCLEYAESPIPRPVEHILVEELVDPSMMECEEIARNHFHTNQCEDVLRYLGEGQHCYIARYETKIVSWFWITRQNFYDYHLHRNISLSDEEDYYLGAYTIPEFRGKGIVDYLVLEAIQIILRQSTGARRRAIGFVDVKNLSSQKACHKMGFRLAGHIGYINVFGIRLNYITGQGVLPRTRPRLVLTH